MSPQEYEERKWFYEILKQRHLIQDFELSEDGSCLKIKPIPPLDFVAIDWNNEGANDAI